MLLHASVHGPEIIFQLRIKSLHCFSISVTSGDLVRAACMAIHLKPFSFDVPFPNLPDIAVHVKEVLSDSAGSADQLNIILDDDLILVNDETITLVLVSWLQHITFIVGTKCRELKMSSIAFALDKDE